MVVRNASHARTSYFALEGALLPNLIFQILPTAAFLFSRLSSKPFAFLLCGMTKKKRGRKGFQNFEVSSLSLPPFFLGRHGTTQLGIMAAWCLFSLGKGRWSSRAVLPLAPFHGHFKKLSFLWLLHRIFIFGAYILFPAKGCAEFKPQSGRTRQTC